MIRGIESTAPILITGAAGFIGFQLARRLLAMGRRVIGIDNLNDYYDVGLKHARLERLRAADRFSFLRMDIADPVRLEGLFARQQLSAVLHMAAQAGVRHSIENPQAFIRSNVQGFLNVLEGCRKGTVRHLVFASSSSVYGSDGSTPFSVHHRTDHPASLYAATKKSNELIAHAYASLYGIPCTGVRLFTVYGPWGRPDMAVYSFTKDILEGRPINLFNHGRMRRDFTFIDDIVEMILRVMDRVPTGDPRRDAGRPDALSNSAPYRVYNLGRGEPAGLAELIALLEESLGRRAVLNMLPAHPADAPETFADMRETAEAIGFLPATSLKDGLRQFVDWYRSYHAPAVPRFSPPISLTAEPPAAGILV